MSKIIRLDDIRKERAAEDLETFKAKFIENVQPGAIVYLALDQKIYWDIGEGKVVTEPGFPDRFPLMNYIGFMLPHSDMKVGPDVNQFSPYLPTGDKHTGIRQTFPWEHILGYKVLVRSRIEALSELILGEPEPDPSA